MEYSPGRRDLMLQHLIGFISGGLFLVLCMYPLSLYLGMSTITEVSLLRKEKP